MKKVVLCLTLACGGALLFNSCQDKNLYQGTLQEQKEKLSGFEYSQQFENVGYYKANIKSNYEGGRYYAVFTENPYNEDRDIVVEPILSGLTPIEGQFVVPSGVQKLYVLSDAGLREYNVGDLYISDDNTRADNTLEADDFEALRKYIDNQVLPEAKFNIRGEDLYKCTDLVTSSIEDHQVVSVWVSLVRNNDVPGPIWYYTYTGNNPTVDDCTFYGQNSKGEAVTMTYSDIKTKKNNYIMNKSTATNKEILLGHKLEKGEKLGFMYYGNIGWRYTTPSLNTPENTKHDSYRAHNTLGCKVLYTAPDSFELTKPVLGGAFMHFTLPYNGNEYNVVGFENRLPGEKTTTDGKNNGNYDGDYNDMVFLVRSNPEGIAPEEELPRPQLKFTTSRTGVWLFEDNYPETGDFDFNDVVVYYEIKTCEGMMDVSCWLAAYGCDFHNEVGIMVLSSKNAWKTPKIKRALWKNVRGYKNVEHNGEKVNLSSLQFRRDTVVCGDYALLRPYLDNGNGECTPEHYNTSDYPYALDVPSYIGGTKHNDAFCWPKEGCPIDNAYWFLKNQNGGSRKSDWYKTVKDAEMVVTLPGAFFQPIKK